jgi:thiol-disulfide isomerase/thioredoxin
MKPGFACGLSGVILATGLFACAGPDTTVPAGDDSHASAAGTVEIPWFQGSLEEAFAAARERTQPVFLYWGAEWCPYCRDLEMHVFAAPEFARRLDQFVPVHLDGDLAGAQRAAEQFAVAGYPTVVLLSPDREELFRVAGGMEFERYGEALELVLGEWRPVTDVLAAAARPDAATELNDCRRLAWHAWGLEDTQSDRYAALAESLALAGDACRASAPAESARLATFAIAYLSSSERNAIEGGAPGSALLHDLLDRLAAVLGDEQLTDGAGDALGYLDTDFFVVLRTLRPPQTEDWLARFSAAMQRLAGAASYTEANRLGAFESILRARRLLVPDETLTAEAREEALQRVEQALARTGDSRSRPSVVNAAVNLYDTLGLHEQAYQLVERELAVSSTPYYPMATLAALEERMGRPDRAVDWLARAYQSSSGAATRFQWGTNYVRGLIRLRPEDADRIVEATLQVLDELDGPERIYRRSGARLDALQSALEAWHEERGREQEIARIRERMAAICARVPADEPLATERCGAFVRALSG